MTALSLLSLGERVEKACEVYRGHLIELSREACQGGWDLLYYSIYRESDGFECVANFTEEESPLETYMGYMRERIDAELASDDPWDESRDPFE